LVDSIGTYFSGSITVSGEGGTDIALGADGGYIQSIDVNGLRSYSPGDAAIQSFTTAAGATVVINFQTGAYTYVIPDTATIPTGTQEVFALTVIDGDGDVVTGGSLTINVQNTVVANGEEIISNLGGLSDIPDSVLLENDVELNFDSLSVAVRSDNSDNTIDYTVSNGVESHDVSANVTFESGNQLQGSDADEVLLAGSGDDILVGGGGDDILVGGDGADSFEWQSGDAGTAGSPVTDFISDFSRSEGDALNLADLLVDDTVGTLTDYLHFEQQIDGAETNTLVQISSGGGFTGGNFDPSQVDQTILLQGVDLTGIGDDQAIIDALMSGSNLIT
jgi:Ca2+-binding RTX toxin-like protein